PPCDLVAACRLIQSRRAPPDAAAGRRKAAAVMNLPLAGLKVLDLTWHIAGPYCTKMLADLGADVIKIERPHHGDPARHTGPFPGDRPDPERSGTFLSLNTNKRSVTLDLKTPTGRSLFFELLQWADVLAENFTPGVMERLGLGYDRLRQERPQLVMTSISNFGQTGPYRLYKAPEMVAQAANGLMGSTGDHDREPLRYAQSQSQMMAGGQER
ncbi:MAG: CoA transferase, partial [Chloroflexi bacterium]|nr:CoA transferase [Chloroflexota bacterium]